MEFDQIIKKLEKLLCLPLPGKSGQISMAPMPIDESRFAELKPKNPRKGAVLMLFYPDERGTYIPFIKRPDYDGTHGGQIAFPGGKWEASDLDLSQTALRETEEEIGLDQQKVILLGNLSDLFIPASNFLVSPYIGFVERTPTFSPDPYEVDKIISCPFKILTDKSIRKDGEIVVKKEYKLRAPYFDIDAHVVWGATAMILGEFIHLWENN